MRLRRQSLTNAACAEVLESPKACDCDGNVLDESAYAVVLESLKARATATATSLTNVACAEVLESPKARATVTETSSTSAALRRCWNRGRRMRL